MEEPLFTPLAPSTPPRLYPPSPSSELPSLATPRAQDSQYPLIVNIASPTTPPANYLLAKKRVDRPETPLDFMSFDPARPSSDLGHGNTVFDPPPSSVRMQSLSASHERAAKPGPTLDRPQVEAHVKGIPQGWDDDHTIPIPILAIPSDHSVPPPHKSKLFHGSSPRKDPPDGLMSPPRPNHLRLSSFRETKAKLSTLGQAMKEKARGYDHRPTLPGGSTGKLQAKVLPFPAPAEPLLGGHKGATLSKGRSRPQMNRAASDGLSSLPHDSSRNSSIAAVKTPLHEASSEPSLLSTELSERPTASSITASTDSLSAGGLFSALNLESGYEPSLTSTESSVPSLSNREHVMGLRGASSYNHLTAISKVFLPPNKADVLPWTTATPFAAWDIPLEETLEDVAIGGERSKESLASRVSKREEGVWVEVQGNRGRGSSIGSPVKRVFVDLMKSGEAVYKVGWERDVLDLEGRLHETMYDVAGERHSFVSYEEGKEPKAVLDIGTGSGLWPISQALVWPNTTFVGLDLVPCQTDLNKLVRAEEIARSTSVGEAIGGGIWKDVERRVSWARGDFLESLPFDSGVFDLVHIRFIGLGVPEDRWSDVLGEAARVLRPGGHLEIVEMSLQIPGHPHTSLRNSFASLLLADMIQPRPSLPIQFGLPLVPGLKGLRGRGSVATPIFEETWSVAQGGPPGALRDAAMVWAKSALEYKGTGMRRKRDSATVEMMKRELHDIDPRRWKWEEKGDTNEVPDSARGEGESVTVWAWVGVKK